MIAAHPLKGNRASLLPQAAALAEAGYGVLLLDLRAHGASDGEATSFEGTDVEAAAAYLAARPTGHIGGWRAREDEYRIRVIIFFDQALLADNPE